VSAAAGNSGPASGTVAHPSPWITTVAAGTHDRGEGSVTLGSGTTFSGTSLATATAFLPLIDATAAGLTGADPAAVALCYSTSVNGGKPALDPAKVAGKIVVCDRGSNVRVDKSLAVREAGGAGMLLLNVTPNSVNADFHYVPAVHLSDTVRDAVKAYVGGQLTWTDGVHSVRSPVVVRPLSLAAPAQVSSTGGPINYNVTFGYTGGFTASPRGLVAATTTDGSVTDDPGDAFNPMGPGVVSFPVTIDPGTSYARFSLFNANVSPASDIDLYVYRGTTLVAASGGGTSNEEANLVDPIAGNYTVYVHGFAVPGTATFTLFTWRLGMTAAGNMAVTAPAAAVTGATGTIGLTFSGLTPGTKYLGSVAYDGVAGLPNPTIVRVDP